MNLCVSRYNIYIVNILYVSVQNSTIFLWQIQHGVTFYIVPTRDIGFKKYWSK